ncbi:MAG: type VI secretion system baseplate subunit TssF [Gammaproteobacteria bacterium]|nr:type VI secretion system baseplate subunit TssF [Gammaproteobacteria bacterium]MYH46192.1 type VI secretion system baseplate subunit TssF [Gammaproteobacteria bacterium]MYL12600.1 type VI secretion system baseplate subunit TssF [Gammaproteobacteria bacterium]
MIDDQLFEAYLSELEAMRTHGRNFAERFPEVAARLDIGPRESRDAHVERVVESSAFLSARLRRMVAEDATELPLAALAVIAPALVEPVPSMAIMRLAGGDEEETAPARSRFDATLGGAPVCFSTATPVTASPLALRVSRIDPGPGYADGVAVHLDRGAAPEPWLLYLGADQRTGAQLMDAIDESLERVEVTHIDGTRTALPRTAVRIEGFADADAMLPRRPATHDAHRLLTEFLVFPERFRFVSIHGAGIAAGSELRLLFRVPLSLPRPLPPDLVSANCVPVVNYWSTNGAPIEVTGRELEYPVKVDTLRYRTVECHSVEAVDIYYSESTRPQRIDPLIALGRINETALRWGMRRQVARFGGEVRLYFQGLDYSELGRSRILAIPRLLANNRDLAQHVRSGQSLIPVDGLGSWRGVVQVAPSQYRLPMSGERTMRTLIGYLQSSMVGLTREGRRGAFRHFLKSFPGGDQASWIDGIGPASFEPVTALRGGSPEAGVAVAVAYDSASHPVTSRAIVRRVLARLLESQRGLNRVEELRLNA